ncbi:MAG: hypothetical protein HYR91_11375 [Flavobacteriia bacterium]|nr:hypothetical protein [Flavobacteriia bacterium]
MKQLAFISGALSFSIIGISFLFKIHHWPMTNILTTICLSMFSLLFVPLYTKYLYDKSN